MKFVFFFSFISFNLFAQIASSSLFKEMRSENPAIIQERKAATFSLKAKQDNVTKEQDASSPLDSSESDISITTTSFFYGGKGGGLTSEFSGEIASGTKEDSLVVSGTDYEVKQEANIASLSYQFGFLGWLGLGFQYVTEDRTQTGNEEGEYDTSVTVVTLGTKFKPGFDFGIFYQYGILDVQGEFEGDDVSSTSNIPRVGIGIGFTGNTTKFELGYITSPIEEEQDQGGGSGPGDNTITLRPSKAIVSLEMKLSALSIGLTSSIYQDGYFDYNNILYYTMVLSGNTDTRIENAINFSLGSDKGHSFSGTYSVSEVESKELPPTLSSGTKYKTTTSIQTLGVSYAYAF